MELICGINNVTIEASDESGALLQRQTQHNRMVATGRNHFRDLLQGIGTAPNYIACGTLDPGDVSDYADDLLAERERVACHSRIVMDNKAIFMATFDRDTIWSWAALPVKEFGLFAGTTYVNSQVLHDGGIMICQVRCAPIDISAHLATIFVVWEIPLYAE